MSTPSLDDLLKHLSLTPDSLEVEIAERFFDAVAPCLSNWEGVARMCEIHVRDYRIDYHSEEARKIAFLRGFKGRFLFNATYKLLVTKLFGMKLAEDARKVCQVFKDKVLPDLAVQDATQDRTVPISTESVLEKQLSSQHLTLIKWQGSYGDVEELRLYNEMAPDWNTVADLVGISTAVTGSIKKNFREVEDCIKTAIQRWIDDAPNLPNYKCTWNGLCTLLRDMKKGAVQKRLKQAIAADVSTLKKNFSADSESTSQSSNISAEVDDTAAIEGAAAATPAKARGTKKLNPVELYAWLLGQGVDEEDATKLKEKGVNEIVFMMISKKMPQLYNILKEGTRYMLEYLQEELKNRK